MHDTPVRERWQLEIDAADAMLLVAEAKEGGFLPLSLADAEFRLQRGQAFGYIPDRLEGQARRLEGQTRRLMKVAAI
jgi:hypothetical protein